MREHGEILFNIPSQSTINDYNNPVPIERERERVE
jgi:hypothetical protein